MNKHFYKKGRAIVAALLCAIILLGAIPVAYASPRSPLEPLSDPSRFHYGVQTAEDNVTLTAADLFDLIFAQDGVVLSDEERAYLAENLYSLIYNKTVPTDAIQRSFDVASGTLTLTAPVYSYTTESGERAEWIPTEATLDGTTVSFTLQGDVYVCQFDGLTDKTADFDVKVRFSQMIGFEESVIEAFLMQSRTDGAAAREQLDDYAEKKQKYDRDFAAYKAWSEYPAKLAARLEYEEKLSKYLIQKAAYEKYLSEMESYPARKQAYEEYLEKKTQYELDWSDYEQYKLELAAYQTAYNAFTAYRDRMALIRGKLQVLEMLYVADSNGWFLADSVQGPTVAQVLAREDELTILNKGEQVTAAGDSTEVLRALLKTYTDLRKAKYASDFERYQVLYAFYVENYAALRLNFRKLYEALYNLYSEGAISDYIEQDGKGPHFRQFLGQLYITTCCLDDSEALDTNWTPTSRWYEKLYDVVEECQRVSDTVQADPTGVDYPQAIVTEPTPITEVKPPVAPTVVHEPEEPVPVDEPTEPTFVPDPGPQRPPYVQNPGDPPTPPALSDAMKTWADAYSDVDYAAREALVSPRSITLTAETVCPVSIRNYLFVRFFSHDGTLLKTESVPAGTSLSEIVAPEDPTRDATAQYVYDFLDWYRFDGTPIDESTELTTDYSVRATYERYLCQYKITWKVDGRIVKTEMCDYGTVPHYEVADKTVGTYDYIFSGWTPEPVRVTGNAVYTGFYQKVLRKHSVTWMLDGGERAVTDVCAEGTVPTFEGVRDYVKNGNWYRFLRWDKTVKALTEDVTYTAVYDAPVAISGDVSVSIATDGVNVTPRGGRFSLETLSKIASNNATSLYVKLGDLTAELTLAALTKLKQDGCVDMELATLETSLKNGTGYQLIFYGANGGVLQTDVAVKLSYRYVAASNAVFAYYEQSGEVWKAMESHRQAGVLSAERQGGGSFWIGKEYYVLYDPIDTCNTLLLPDRAVVGNWVELGGASCVYGYEITQVLLTMADGSTLLVEGDGFIMPEGGVSVTLTVEEIVYRVSFVVDGKVISTKEYRLGDQVILPADPTLDKGDGMIYTFTGWSPQVTLVGGDEREIVYTAEFMSSAPVSEEDRLNQESNDIAARLALFAAIGIILVGGTVTVIVVIRKKRKH